MKSIFALTLFAFVFTTFPAFSQAPKSDDAKKQWTVAGKDPLNLSWNGKLVTSYQTSAEFPKPYFYPLIGPTGENVTRHWPMKEGVKGEAKDHPHHRGMWFALGSVEGYDFWHVPASGKKPKPFGKIVNKEISDIVIDGSTASFKAAAVWQGIEAGKEPVEVMEDVRVFKFTKRDDGTLIVDAKITLNATFGDVTINDDKEGAWSIRVMPTLRLKGEVAKGNMVNSNGQEGRDVWGKRASWVDYVGPTPEGKTLGIAIMDHPKNLRYPTWYHARDYGLFTANPFGQGNFEKGSKKGAGDYTIKNGESLTFNYRTIFHHGDAKAAKIEEEFKEWSAEEVE